MRRMRWASLTAALVRRRRTLGLGALALMAGMLFWGRLLMQDVPRTAIADPELLLVERTESSPLGRDEPTRRVARVRRDPFRHADSDGTDQLNEIIEKNGVSGRKSSHELADEQQRRETVTGEAASRLSLEQTWLGGRPRARISGRLVRPGQSVHGFTVRNIQNGKVVLQKDGIVIVLEM